MWCMHSMYVPSASVDFSKDFSGLSYVSVSGSKYAMMCESGCNGV